MGLRSGHGLPGGRGGWKPCEALAEGILRQQDMLGTKMRVSEAGRDSVWSAEPWGSTAASPRRQRLCQIDGGTDSCRRPWREGWQGWGTVGARRRAALCKGRGNGMSWTRHNHEQGRLSGCGRALMLRVRRTGSCPEHRDTLYHFKTPEIKNHAPLGWDSILKRHPVCPTCQRKAPSTRVWGP